MGRKSREEKWNFPTKYNNVGRVHKRQFCTFANEHSWAHMSVYFSQESLTPLLTKSTNTVNFALLSRSPVFFTLSPANWITHLNNLDMERPRTVCGRGPTCLFLPTWFCNIFLCVSVSLCVQQTKRQINTLKKYWEII